LLTDKLMKTKIIILTIVAAFSFGCTKTSTASLDSSTSVTNAEIALAVKPQLKTVVTEKGDQDIRVENGRTVNSATDNSEIETTTDRFGNKIVKRTFKSNGKISFVLVTSSSLKGDTTIKVFGKNGQAEQLPFEKYQNILNLSGNEIASAANIKEPVDRSLIVENANPVVETPLANLPKVAVPKAVSTPVVVAKNPQTEPVVETETNEPTETENKEADKPTVPKDKDS
jgi:hypothetical protein